MAARELAALGYNKVREYVEGKQDWIQAGMPAEGEHPREPITQTVRRGVRSTREREENEGHSSLPVGGSPSRLTGR